MGRLGTVLLSLLIAAAPAGAATLGDARVGFTADRTLVIDGHSYVGKIWAMPGKERHEQTIMGFRPVFLLSAKNPVGDIVLDQLKTIVQFVLPPELRMLAHAPKKDPLGRDTVNGVATTEYAVDEVVPQGHAQGTVWLSGDGIPMKLVGTFIGQKGKATAVRWELSHVKVGPQPAALFEAPHGFSVLPAEAIAPLLGLKLKSAQR